MGGDVDIFSEGSGDGGSGAGGCGRGGAVGVMARLLTEFEGLGVDEQLVRMGTGGALLERLLALDLDATGDGGLVEAVAAANRISACAEAVRAQAAGVLAERASMNPPALAVESVDADTGRVTATDAEKGCTAPEELAVRLGWTRGQCRDLVRRGRAWGTHLVNTGEALRWGWIDAERGRVIADGLADSSWQVAMAVEDEVLPGASGRSAGQLRRDIARALIAVDPAEAEARAQRRRARRRVSRPRVLADEVAAMTIEGPAADVLALDQALHAHAKAAKSEGDSRTMGQLRFDALAGVGSQALVSGHLGPKHLGLPLAQSEGRKPEVHVTVPIGHLIPDAPAQANAGTGASTGTGAHPNPDPGLDPGVGVDCGDEAGVLRRMLTAPPAPAPAGTSACTCGGRRIGSAEPADSTGSGVSAGLEAPWYVPSETVIDVGPSISGEAVPFLSGYGPITPATARALAAGGIWRRLVTDPVTDQLLDLGHTRYRPSSALADHVRARDVSCVRPGCSTPATECQLDHTLAWDHTDPGEGGSTAPANLGPLCQRDHQAKTHGDFELEQTAPGVFEWTTPTGHRYRRNPDGSTTPLSHHPDTPPPF
ncbi:HNH endonuclease signature motif containing protein [Ruania zhangjianzhongii]|uniref:HNH endonuclease signature motif containing protein n=1 Tax=Ruania zhangjianzhongii TaxID=2603206 RepID=UPI0011CB9BC4|nr:HNH endonuclease signature motif containing protein [Ruania zhangjianzhongii]